jgi:hypothetical protein
MVLTIEQPAAWKICDRYRLPYFNNRNKGALRFEVGIGGYSSVPSLDYRVLEHCKSCFWRLAELFLNARRTFLVFHTVNFRDCSLFQCLRKLLMWNVPCLTLHIAIGKFY